jgi:hypothetical protein
MREAGKEGEVEVSEMLQKMQVVRLKLGGSRCGV